MPCDPNETVRKIAAPVGFTVNPVLAATGITASGEDAPFTINFTPTSAGSGSLSIQWGVATGNT
jgi:hypothetical protein